MSDGYEIEPAEAQKQLSSNQATLLDVREPEEFALSHLENSVLVPMGSIPPQLQRLEQMADQNTLLVLCHHGVRSLQVVAWLRAQGIDNCYSINGGIDRWSRELDTDSRTHPFGFFNFRSSLTSLWLSKTLTVFVGLVMRSDCARNS
jgi:rhodanese-related sulfurtransferase